MLAFEYQAGKLLATKLSLYNTERKQNLIKKNIHSRNKSRGNNLLIFIYDKTLDSPEKFLNLSENDFCILYALDSEEKNTPSGIYLQAKKAQVQNEPTHHVSIACQGRIAQDNNVGGA